MCSFNINTQNAEAISDKTFDEFVNIFFTANVFCWHFQRPCMIEQ